MTFDQRLEELKVSTPGRGFTRLNERLNTCWLERDCSGECCI